ncbi:MAG TPA: bacterial transcriptional activator domain-containing protein [Chloroflexia bacterium]|nr:bacterial transcriptional activator domain-containing protein [Chloroflexia bacterium]
MAGFAVRLFGKFHLEHDKQVVRSLEGCKAQELFYYLLLNRQRQHPRETLATLLWGYCTTTQSKKYLRQALWQIQVALGSEIDANCEAGSGDQYGDDGRLLQVDPEWVSVNAKAGMWLDVEVFEQAHALAHGIPGQELDGPVLQAIQQAVSLYTGDLLEGCYHDWCLFERERLQNVYLGMLDKLISYSLATRDYEAGLDYGECILRYNRARERTHREMMRLRYLAGDRTAALQQYGSCVAILRDELSAIPAHSTVELYEQILADDLPELVSTHQPVVAQSYAAVETPLSALLDHLQQLSTNLGEVQQQIKHDLNAIRAVLRRH